MSDARDRTSSGPAVAADSPEVLETFFATTEMMVAYLDPQFNFIRVNRAYVEATGKESSDFFTGKNHFELYPHAENEAIFREVVRTGQAHTCRAKRFEHPDQIERGATFWDWTVYPVHDSGRRVVGVILCLVDVTDSVKAEAAYRSSEKRFREVLAQLPDGVCIAVDDRITYSNPALQKMTSLSAEELGEYSVAALFQLEPDDERRLQRQLFAAREGAAKSPLQCQIACGADESRTVEVSAKMITLSSQTSVLYVLRDITERVRIEGELRQTQKLEAIGRLAGGVAHDFNNLLTVIMNHAFLGGMETEPGTSLGRAFEEIGGAAKRAAALTRQLLLFSRKEQPHLEVLEVARAIDGMSGILRRLVGEAIELTCELEPALIRADPAQLEQVLLNLVLNARDAIGEIGEIGRISLVSRTMSFGAGQEPTGDFVELIVSDDGCGMSEQTRLRLFEPFFTTKPAGRGTGLGLATVYGVVQRHDGFIRVASEPGKGTTFRVYFPRVSGQVATDGGRETPRFAGLRGDETILLVDDDVQVRTVARQCLELFGYRVLETDGADGARTLFDNHPAKVDLLLADVVLRGENGFALAKSLQARAPDLPVLFMSGYTAETFADAPEIDLGERLMAKPFTPYELGRRIRAALRRGS